MRKGRLEDLEVALEHEHPEVRSLIVRAGRGRHPRHHLLPTGTIPLARNRHIGMVPQPGGAEHGPESGSRGGEGTAHRGERAHGAEGRHGGNQAEQRVHRGDA